MDKPYLIQFPKLGESTLGYISVAENTAQVPFVIKRVFWTYFTPESVVRGRHAHYTTQQVLIAVAGRILVTTESPTGEIQNFILDSPDKGVYVPANAWHTMQYSHNAVQLVLASSEYNEQDYIRRYDEYKNIYHK